MATNKKNRKVLWISVAAICGILVLVLVLFLTGVLGSKPDDEKNPDGNTTAETDTREKLDYTLSPVQDGVVWPWDCQTLCQQFPMVIYNDYYYSAKTDSTEEDKTVSAELIGEKLCDTVADGYDWHNDIAHTLDCSLYAMKGVDPERFLAVKYAGRDAYYVFKQDELTPPATLGELISGLNLTETAPLTLFYYQDKNENASRYGLTPEDASAVWNMLSEHADAETTIGYESSDPGEQIGFSVTAEALGTSDTSIILTEDGYLLTDIEGYNYNFSLGKKAAKELREFILSHKIQAPEDTELHLVGVVTTIGEDYLVVDDSVIMKNPEDGMEYTVSAHDMRIKRYIDSGYLQLGNCVRIRYTASSDNTSTDIRTAFLLEAVNIDFNE